MTRLAHWALALFLLLSPGLAYGQSQTQKTRSVDGAHETQGAKADAAVTDSTTTNSLMSFLKGLVKIFADVWDDPNNRLNVAIQNTPAVTVSGTVNNQYSNITVDADTGAGTQTLTLFGIALPASGGAVAGGTSSNPLNVVFPSAQAVTGSGNFTVVQSTGTNLHMVCDSGCGSGTQYAEDTAHSSGDQLSMAGVVQQSADAALAGDGDRTALQVDNNGYLKVNIKAGAAAGGTSSNFGSAFPSAGTAMGLSDGTNLRPGLAIDGDTGGGTQYVQAMNLVKRASGGTVEAGTSSDPLRTDPTGTTTQPVSGTVTANAGTNLNTSALLTTSAHDAAFGTAGTADAQVRSIQGIAGMTAVVVDSEMPAAAQITSDAQTAPTAPFIYSAIMCRTPGANTFDRCLGGLSDTDDNSVAVSQVPGVTLNLMYGLNSDSASGVWTRFHHQPLDYDSGAGTENLSVLGLAIPGSGGPLGVTGATRGSQNALSVQIVDASGNQVTSFGGSGGTASNYGSAFPASGTAVGFSDGTNMQGGRVVDADTGAGTVYVQGVNLLKRASGGPVEAGTSSDPLRTDPTGTTTQPVSASSLPLPTGASTLSEQQTQTTALQLIDDIVHASDAALSKAALIGCQFDDVSPGTTTENNVRPIRCSTRREVYGQIRDAAGNERGLNIDANGEIGIGAIRSALPAGTNAIGKLAANSGVDIGDVDVTSVPADPFGANADAASATGSISAKLRFIASTGIPITGTVTVGSHAVTNAGTFATQDSQVITDDAAFTAGTSKVFVSGFVADEASTDSVNEDDAGAARMTLDRIQWAAPAAVTASSQAATPCYVQSGTGTTASTNAANCKASAGNFYGVRAVNTTGTLAYLRMYNASGSPTCSSATGFIESIPIPANSTGAGIVSLSQYPIAYSTGIAYCVTGGGGNTDNTNAPAGVYITLLTK